MVKKPIETHIYRHANTNKAVVVKELLNYMKGIKRRACSNCCLQLAGSHFVQQSTFVVILYESCCLFVLQSAGGVPLHREMSSAKW